MGRYESAPFVACQHYELVHARIPEVLSPFPPVKLDHELYEPRFREDRTVRVGFATVIFGLGIVALALPVLRWRADVAMRAATKAAARA